MDEKQRSKCLPPRNHSLMSIISEITPVRKLVLLTSYGDYINEMVCNTHGVHSEFNFNLVQTFLSLDKPGISHAAADLASF